VACRPEMLKPPCTVRARARASVRGWRLLGLPPLLSGSFLTTSCGPAANPFVWSGTGRRQLSLSCTHASRCRKPFRSPSFLSGRAWYAQAYCWRTRALLAPAAKFLNGEPTISLRYRQYVLVAGERRGDHLVLVCCRLAYVGYERPSGPKFELALLRLGATEG
jgi:hypothetical protein